MKKNAFSWWEAVVVLALLGILAAILFPALGGSNRGHSRRNCQSHLKQISISILQYLQDYEYTYPRTNLEGQGWVDMLQPYLHSTDVFQCGTERSGRLAGTTDYFYNARLAGESQASLDFINRTIMNGDSLGDSPANFSLTKLPAVWNTDTDSPAWRHGEGANYSFADGHVKWFKPKDISGKEPALSLSTFAPQ